ncbi:uncharacterized protein LOC107361367 [Tetranychus urticae]|uniref:uncharacterized protein LOC107361367 n=1 Tax=Tetranychus urticae TaxID=32264 RepID=UPI00077BCAEF|nr:uncharacterized protein LOC107361367 [Tetranychus urticae]
MEKDANFDAKLQIINRTRIYNVSKKFMCSSVPYFEKMFSCDLLESKENKVVLDFDERVLDSILDWVHSESFCMQMDYVISFYEAADYLMINERLFQPCLSYFHDNFTIEHLSVILPQVTKLSKLINSGAIERCICRHFLTITHTNIFLNYPLETVEAILKLDLMIHSEYQIFESIIKWVNKNVDSRKASLPQLLKCVRWSYMDFGDISKIKDNDLIKALPNLDLVKSSYVGFNRSKQNFFISFHQRDASILRLKVFDNDFFCFMIGDFSQDDSISLEFVHGEHISDILFDCGTKGVRIDWVKKAYRWLDFKVVCKTYYIQLWKFIVEVCVDENRCYLEDKDSKLHFKDSPEEYLLLESDGKFIAIGKNEKKWFGIFTAKHGWWFNNYKNYGHSFQATVSDDVVYILTKDLEFIRFNIESRSFDKSEPFKGKGWIYNDLILTSHQTKDDKVILVNKSSGKVYYFCINKMQWIEKCCIMNVNFLSDSSCAPVNQLVAFTSNFLPMKVIEPLYDQKAT